MKKKLYYVVEKELQGTDGFVEETTGNKTVSVYEVENNEIKKFTDLDILVEESSLEAIQEYLDDNGYEDEEYEFIEL